MLTLFTFIFITMLCVLCVRVCAFVFFKARTDSKATACMRPRPIHSDQEQEAFRSVVKKQKHVKCIVFLCILQAQSGNNNKTTRRKKTGLYDDAFKGLSSDFVRFRWIETNRKNNNIRIRLESRQDYPFGKWNGNWYGSFWMERVIRFHSNIAPFDVQTNSLWRFRSFLFMQLPFLMKPTEYVLCTHIVWQKEPCLYLATAVLLYSSGRASRI